MAEYLFLYGTLQPGHAPAAIASAAARLRPTGEGHVHGTLYDFGHYPGAILDASTQRKIFGSVYELPDDPDVLRRLDDYEELNPDAPQLGQYLRVLHPVTLSTGETMNCWIYIYNRDPGPARIVESGRWGRAAG
ncbi:MAG: gamma-glutamylcyclotransferase family protein [Terracidiphilus sp.]|jgi:gamma-glutamylcyclotransferase (GGCT)/AIG2-like uncharacterized protein YtfP